MTDREKVINGLKTCVMSGTREDCEGYGCPYFIYNDAVSDDCQVNLFGDALALLEAQEPRLVTEADFENADEYGFIPVWCEERDKNCYLDHWECIPRTALETAKEDRCRYWTSKPSLKQMEETPWK